MTFSGTVDHGPGNRWLYVGDVVSEGNVDPWYSKDQGQGVLITKWLTMLLNLVLTVVTAFHIPLLINCFGFHVPS